MAENIKYVKMSELTTTALPEKADKLLLLTSNLSNKTMTIGTLIDFVIENTTEYDDSELIKAIDKINTTKIDKVEVSPTTGELVFYANSGKTEVARIVLPNVDWSKIDNIPTEFPPAQHNHDDVYVKKVDAKLPIATTTTLGGIKVGDGLEIEADGTLNTKVEIVDGSKTTKGIVQVGDNINVTNGVISVPKATDLTLGVVTKGEGISIGDTGSINVNVGAGIEIDATNNVALRPATGASLGGVKVNNANIGVGIHWDSTKINEELEKNISANETPVSNPLGELLEGDILNGLSAVDILNKILYFNPVSGVIYKRIDIPASSWTKVNDTEYTYTLTHNLNTEIYGHFATDTQGNALIIGGTLVNPNTYKFTNDVKENVIAYIFYLNKTTTKPLNYREFAVEGDYVRTTDLYNWCLAHNLNKDIVGVFGYDREGNALVIPYINFSRNTIGISTDMNGFVKVYLLFEGDNTKQVLKCSKVKATLTSNVATNVNHGLNKNVIGIMADTGGETIMIGYKIIDKNNIEVQADITGEVDLAIIYEV